MRGHYPSPNPPRNNPSLIEHLRLNYSPPKVLLTMQEKDYWTEHAPLSMKLGPKIRSGVINKTWINGPNPGNKHLPKSRQQRTQPTLRMSAHGAETHQIGILKSKLQVLKIDSSQH